MSTPLGITASAILSTGDYRTGDYRVRTTFHCYSLEDMAKTQNLWAFCMCVAPCHPWHRDISPSRHLAIHGDALTSNVLFESWTSPVEFLHAISSALIDAIPLIVLSKLRNFLWAWVDGDRTTGEERRVAVCVFDANARDESLCKFASWGRFWACI